MPAPFKDPRTGIYYFRKTIPSELRQVFGKREYKISLGTRDPVEAKSMMAEPAAAYERLAANARQFLVGGVTAQAGLYVEQWLHDTQRDRLWLISAAKSLTAFNRLTSQSSFFGPAPDYVFEPEARLDADDALMVRTLYTRKRVPAQASLESVSRIDPEFLQWPVLQVIEHHRLIPDEALLRAIGLCIKRQLIEAIIGFLSDRKTAKAASPAPLIVIDNVQSTAPSRFDSADGPEVGLTVTQAFDAWKTYSKGRARKAQLVQEWDLAVRRFVALFGDIDMGRIRPQMVRDFREKLLELPGRTKKSIKALPLDEQATIRGSSAGDETGFGASTIRPGVTRVSWRVPRVGARLLRRSEFDTVSRLSLNHNQPDSALRRQKRPPRTCRCCRPKQHVGAPHSE